MVESILSNLHRRIWRNLYICELEVIMYSKSFGQAQLQEISPANLRGLTKLNVIYHKVRCLKLQKNLVNEIDIDCNKLATRIEI